MTISLRALAAFAALIGNALLTLQIAAITRIAGRAIATAWMPRPPTSATLTTAALTVATMTISAAAPTITTLILRDGRDGGLVGR